MVATTIKKTEDFLREAMVCTAESRNKQHGDKAKNHANIARTKSGSLNKDDLIDGASYLAIAGEMRYDD